MQKIHTLKQMKAKVILVIGLIALVLVYLLVAWNNNLFPFAQSNQSFEPGEQIVNMNKTLTEKQSTENLEKNPENKLENSQTDTPPLPKTNEESGKQIANVLVTNAGVFNGKVSASGFATNVVETGGVCEYIFTNGSEKLTKTSDTLANATSTTCKTVSFPVSEFANAGTWKVYLRYSSTSSEGVSAIKEFEV